MSITVILLGSPRKHKNLSEDSAKPELRLSWQEWTEGHKQSVPTDTGALWDSGLHRLLGSQPYVRINSRSSTQSIKQMKEIPTNSFVPSTARDS